MAPLSYVIDKPEIKVNKAKKRRAGLVRHEPGSLSG